MIQLRWATAPGTTTKPPTLQYRYIEPGIEFETGKLTNQNSHWTDWEDVPLVVVAPPTTSGEQK